MKLVLNKYYTVKYWYNNTKYESYSCFRGETNGMFYFQEDGGDWLIVKPKDIIEIK